jgi:hypothetical protein
MAKMPTSLPPNHQPADRPTAIEPRLVELCFQTAGLWEMIEESRFGLPLHIDSLRPIRKPDTGTELYCLAKKTGDAGFHADVVDAAGNRYLELAGYRTVAIPGGLSSEQLELLRSAAHKELAMAAGDD